MGTDLERPATTYPPDPYEADPALPPLQRVPYRSPRGILGFLILGLLVLLVFADPIVVLARSLADQGQAIGQLTLVHLWLTVANQWIIIAGLPLLYLLVTHPGRSVLHQVGLAWNAHVPRAAAIGVVTGIGVVVVLSLVVYILQGAGLFTEEVSPIIEDLKRLIQDHPEFILLLSLSAGVCEEILFRGFLQRRVGIVFASVLFGLVHAGYGTVLQIVAPFVLAFVFGALYRYFRTLWAPIAAHFTFDFVQLTLLYFFPEL